MPTTKEILVQMSNAKFSTKLDASNAYWQIAVDDESSTPPMVIVFCICHMAFIQQVMFAKIEYPKC